MADRIDPALSRLAREYPMHGFLQGGCAITWTSTCSTTSTSSTAPACIPLSGEKDYMPYLRDSIAREYARLLVESTYCRNERIGYLSDLYGRTTRTIEAVLSGFPKST